MRITGMIIQCILFCAFLMLAACSSSSNEDLSNYIALVKQRVYPKKIPPIPAAPFVEPYIFPEKLTQRNPFYPIVTLNNQSAIAPDSARKKQVLEGYSLETLQFVGVLEEGRTIWALIKTPGNDSQIIRVRVGDYMGKNFGRITKITDKSIQLEELYQDEGRWKKQETTVSLHGTQ